MPVATLERCSERLIHLVLSDTRWPSKPRPMALVAITSCRVPRRNRPSSSQASIDTRARELRCHWRRCTSEIAAPAVRAARLVTCRRPRAALPHSQLQSQPLPLPLHRSQLQRLLLMLATTQRRHQLQKLCWQVRWSWRTRPQQWHRAVELSAWRAKWLRMRAWLQLPLLPRLRRQHLVALPIQLVQQRAATPAGLGEWRWLWAPLACSGGQWQWQQRRWDWRSRCCVWWGQPSPGRAARAGPCRARSRGVLGEPPIELPPVAPALRPTQKRRCTLSYPLLCRQWRTHDIENLSAPLPPAAAWGDRHCSRGNGPRQGHHRRQARGWPVRPM